MVLVQGVCGVCGRVIRRESPVPLVVLCDCYRECPLCGAIMKPYTPDLSPRVYGSENSAEFDPLGLAERVEGSAGTLYACLNHEPPYYSRRQPVEVELR